MQFYDTSLLNLRAIVHIIMETLFEIYFHPSKRNWKHLTNILTVKVWRNHGFISTPIRIAEICTEFICREGATHWNGKLTNSTTYSKIANSGFVRFEYLLLFWENIKNWTKINWNIKYRCRSNWFHTSYAFTIIFVSFTTIQFKYFVLNHS